MSKNILLLSLFLFSQSAVSQESSQPTSDEKMEIGKREDVSISEASNTDNPPDGKIDPTPDIVGHTPDLTGFTRKTNKGTPYDTR